MDIRITEHLTKTQMKDLIKLYRSAFPASEKKPFWLIRKKQREGISEILGLIDREERLVGLAITIAWQDLLLLDYFAIVKDIRGQGCGGQALRLLQERYRDRRLLLEIETPDVPCENRQQRLQRRHFYQSCGMDSMDYHVELFGVEMEIMTFQCRVGFDEYHAIFSQVYGKRFASRVTLAAEGERGVN